MKRARTVIIGYAAVWGDLARRDDGWVQIRRGAFSTDAAAVSETRPLPMHWDHQSQGLFSAAKIPVGAIVELREDKHGLFMRAFPHVSQDAIDLMEAIRDRTVHGLSVAYDTMTAEFEELPKLGRVVVTKAPLVEISAVNHPAFKLTDVRLAQEDYDDGEPEPAEMQSAAPAA